MVFVNLINIFNDQNENHKSFGIFSLLFVYLIINIHYYCWNY